MSKKNWKPLLFAVVLLAGIFAWERISPVMFPPQAGSLQDHANLSGTTEVPSSTPAASELSAPETSQPGVEKIHLTFLGDMMCHPTQYEAVQTEEGYDFRPSFEDIKEYTSHADLTLANLETTLAGKGKMYGGYPSFNTPEQFALAINDPLGVDVVSTANNHSLDRHFSGLAQTLDFLDQFGLKHTGTYRTEKESEDILLLDVKGMKTAFLSYTYGTNGIVLPADKGFAVNYIDRDKIRRDAQKARDLGADLVIASIHWGQEYANTPSNEQKNLAHWIMENTEVAVISGNHVHAVQPIEFLKVIHKDTGTEKEGLVVYAQGNFISDQKTDTANKGILVDITLDFDLLTKEIQINRVAYTPTFVDETPGAGLKTYRVLNVEKSLQDYPEGKDSLLNEFDYREMLAYVKEVKAFIPSTDRIKYRN